MKVGDHHIAQQIRHYVASTLLGIVGGLFVAKYATRLAIPGVGMGVAFALLFPLILSLVQKVFSKGCFAAGPRGLKFLHVCILAAALAAVIILPSETRVGRLPAINGWISDFLSCRFPYHPPVRPSGFPVLFLLAIPGFIIGNPGVTEVFGLALFLAALHLLRGLPDQDRWLQTTALLLMPTVYYEIMVRSELFFNMSLAVVYIILAMKWLPGPGSWRKSIAAAILGGLLLSTRAIVFAAFVVAGIFLFRNAGRRGLVLGSIMIGSFAVTLLPFYLWNPSGFVQFGPFSVQMAYLPLWSTACLVILAVLLGFTASRLEGVIFKTGILLFIAASAGFTVAALDSGFAASLMSDRFDISYFIFCTPFLLLSLGTSEQATLTTHAYAPPS